MHPTRHPQPQTVAGLAPILSLPYDVMLEIFTFLASNDIFHLLTTCHALYPLNHDEPIWRMLSARYGVHNNAIFGSRSFRTIYTRLLHTYGPLLGLWANDHPFRGNIIQFRIAPDRWRHHSSHALIGEVWQFPPAADLSPAERQEPQLPRYVEFVQIGFSCDDTVQLTWQVRADPTDEATPYADRDTSDTPSLHLLAPSHRSVSLYSIFHPYPHPDFPAPGADAWFDPARELPRLPLEEPPVEEADVGGFPSCTRQQQGAFLYAVSNPADPPNPPALSFFAHPADTLQLHAPPHGFIDRRRSPHPRYYPLRDTVAPCADPAAPGWHAASLAGLWLGAYGPHGTECLFLEHDGARHEVRAWKVTGDINVPRGAHSWVLELGADAGAALADMERELALGLGGAPRRAFWGVGNVSAHGYVRREHVKVVVILVGRDEIRVRWGQSSYVNKYVRYQGRHDMPSDKTCLQSDGWII
ncbi:hypothetical protein B0H21DRAFT_568094 [Amylocystis lapponica]|nr:hypothetical protein B0H21DRAFT_568094 [Amylocystis lapponica]